MVIFADMKVFREEERRENRFYFFAWALVFVFLALRIVLECIVRKENAIDFAAIFSSWLRAVPFLVLFLVHNYLVAPIMIYKKRPGEYIAFAILLLMVFVAWFFWMKDGPEPGMIPPEPPEWGGEPDFSFPDESASYESGRVACACRHHDGSRQSWPEGFFPFRTGEVRDAAAGKGESALSAGVSALSD